MTGYPVLKQSSGPTLSDSLEFLFGKAGLGWVGIFNAATSLPNTMQSYFATQYGRESLKIIWYNG
jgi:hypothetical protein